MKDTHNKVKKRRISDKVKGKNKNLNDKGVSNGELSTNNNVNHSSLLIVKMFDTNVGIHIEDWSQLFVKSIIINDFRSRMTYLRIFERMLDQVSKLYSGSKFISFFVELVDNLREIDIFVIPLFFEWCYILYREKLRFCKNLIRKSIRYEILKSSLIGIISGNIRNYVILLLSYDIETCIKYLFPNSHLKYWIEEFEDVNFDGNSYLTFQNSFWKFGLDVLKTLNQENLINKETDLYFSKENACFCKIESWVMENSKNLDFESFKIRRVYFDNNKLLLLLFNLFLSCIPYTTEFFSLNIELMLRIKFRKLNKNKKGIKNIDFNDCLCKSNIEDSFRLLDDLFEFIIYIIITWIIIYYGIENDSIDEFNILYEESFNILHYLTSNNQQNNSFYIHNISNHIKNIKEIILHFRRYPFFKLNLEENSIYCSEYGQSYVILIINSILNIYKTRNSKCSHENNLSKENDIAEEILITLLFLVLLHPNTNDDTILYLLSNIYHELYSFGFLLIGSCMALLYKKDIFPDKISRRVQLNILNFRSIHLINSQNFPYIQFLHCTYHLISKSYQNYKIINMIFQLFEGNFLQYFRKLSDDDEINCSQEDSLLSVNISLILTSVYMKLLEFFYLNPSLCKLFFEIKLSSQLIYTDDGRFQNDKELNFQLKYNPKVSLLEIFNQLTPRSEAMKIKNNGKITEKFIQDYQYLNEYQDFNFVTMNYSTIVHLLAIIYIPIIKRANMSLYKFKYLILPSNNSEDLHLIENENDNLDSNQQKIEIPKQFCIEFLEEIINYCKELDQKSPFDIDRFISRHALNDKNKKSDFQSIPSLIHTCINDKSSYKKCFVCSIDSYAEYLGIINSLQNIKEEKYSTYNIKKSWLNHAVIISIITILNINININEMDKFNESEINTIIKFPDVSENLFNKCSNYELINELIQFLLYEIKDNTIILKESGDIQRITFRSLLIYLLVLMFKSELGRETLLEMDLKYLLKRLCHLFAFRIECLATNIYNNTELDNKSDSTGTNNHYSTPINRKNVNIDNFDQYNKIDSPISTDSKYVSNTSTPVKKKRITPIIVSRSRSLHRNSMNDMEQFYSSSNILNISKLALREETLSHSCVFHLKIIICAIRNIKELNLINDEKITNHLKHRKEELHFETQNFILNVIEDSLFFLLPSNTLSKRSILNHFKISEIEDGKSIQELDTIYEAEESSEAEEIENSQDHEKKNFQFNNNNLGILKPMNIPYILCDEDFSKEWYMDIIILLIRYLLSNINSIKDISSLITDIASRMTLWNRKENKNIILNVCIELIKFSHDYFYDELPEISLCLLRNYGSQLLPSIKFVFVAMLDKNSLIIDNAIHELPSINALNELKSLHKTISIFKDLVSIFEFCFQLIFEKFNVFSQKDNNWIKHSLNLIDRGIEALSTELLKMERIIIPPKLDNEEEFSVRNMNSSRNFRDLIEYKCNLPSDLWVRYIKECSSLLDECEYIHGIISNNWIDTNNTDCSNYEDKKIAIKETDSDLDNFITFEQCDEGILQENESYSDMKLTPHWNTFIKSLFL